MTKPRAIVTRRRPGEAQDLLSELGIDALTAAIKNGESLRTYSKKARVALDQLQDWISSDPKRSARVREARIESAAHWEEEAERVLSELPDDAQAGAIVRARELASHYRWRARVYCPKDYGDRQQVEHSGNLTLEQLLHQSRRPLITDVTPDGITGGSADSP